MRPKTSCLKKSSPAGNQNNNGKAVRFYNSNEPNICVQYTPPKGLVKRENLNTESPDAWEKSQKLAQLSEQDLRQKAAEQEEMLRRANKRGALALKKAKLDNERKKIMSEFDDLVKASGGIHSVPPTGHLGFNSDIEEKESESGKILLDNTIAAPRFEDYKKNTMKNAFIDTGLPGTTASDITTGDDEDMVDKYTDEIDRINAQIQELLKKIEEPVALIEKESKKHRKKEKKSSKKKKDKKSSKKSKNTDMDEPKIAAATQTKEAEKVDKPKDEKTIRKEEKKSSKKCKVLQVDQLNEKSKQDEIFQGGGDQKTEKKKHRKRSKQKVDEDVHHSDSSVYTISVIEDDDESSITTGAIWDDTEKSDDKVDAAKLKEMEIVEKCN